MRHKDCGGTVYVTETLERSSPLDGIDGDDGSWVYDPTNDADTVDSWLECSECGEIYDEDVEDD